VSAIDRQAVIGEDSLNYEMRQNWSRTGLRKQDDCWCVTNNSIHL